MSRVSLSESDDGNSTNIHATDARTYYSFGSGKPPFLDRIRGKKDLYTSIDDVCKEAFDVTQEARRLSKSKHCPPGAPKNITKTIKNLDRIAQKLKRSAELRNKDLVNSEREIVKKMTFELRELTEDTEGRITISKALIPLQRKQLGSRIIISPGRPKRVHCLDIEFRRPTVTRIRSWISYPARTHVHMLHGKHRSGVSTVLYNVAYYDLGQGAPENTGVASFTFDAEEDVSGSCHEVVVSLIATIVCQLIDGIPSLRDPVSKEASLIFNDETVLAKILIYDLVKRLLISPLSKETKPFAIFILLDDVQCCTTEVLQHVFDIMTQTIDARLPIYFMIAASDLDDSRVRSTLRDRASLERELEENLVASWLPQEQDGCKALDRPLNTPALDPALDCARTAITVTQTLEDVVLLEPLHASRLAPTTTEGVQDAGPMHQSAMTGKQVNSFSNGDATNLIHLAAPPLPPKDRKTSGEPSTSRDSVPSKVAWAGEFDPPDQQSNNSEPLSPNSQSGVLVLLSKSPSMPICPSSRSPSPRRPGRVTGINPITMVESGEQNVLEKAGRSTMRRGSITSRCDNRGNADCTPARSKGHPTRSGRLNEKGQIDLFPGLGVDAAGAEGSAISPGSSREVGPTQESIDTSGLLPLRTTSLIYGDPANGTPQKLANVKRTPTPTPSNTLTSGGGASDSLRPGLSNLANVKRTPAPTPSTTLTSGGGASNTMVPASSNLFNASKHADALERGRTSQRLKDIRKPGPGVFRSKSTTAPPISSTRKRTGRIDKRAITVASTGPDARQSVPDPLVKAVVNVATPTVNVLLPTIQQTTRPGIERSTEAKRSAPVSNIYAEPSLKECLERGSGGTSTQVHIESKYKSPSRGTRDLASNPIIEHQPTTRISPAPQDPPIPMPSTLARPVSSICPSLARTDSSSLGILEESSDVQSSMPPVMALESPFINLATPTDPRTAGREDIAPSENSRAGHHNVRSVLPAMRLESFSMDPTPRPQTAGRDDAVPLGNPRVGNGNIARTPDPPEGPENVSSSDQRDRDRSFLKGAHGFAVGSVVSESAGRDQLRGKIINTGAVNNYKGCTFHGPPPEARNP